MKLIFPIGVSGLTTLYAVVQNADGQYRRTDTNAWEAYNATNWAANGYRVAVAEDGSSGTYTASLPTGVTAADAPLAQLRNRGGSDDSPGDALESLGAVDDTVNSRLAADDVPTRFSDLDIGEAGEVQAVVLPLVGWGGSALPDIPTAQETRDAMKLAPSAGKAADGSLDALIAALPDAASLAATGVTVYSAVEGYDVTIYQGDSHETSTGREIDFVKPSGAEWPSTLSGWTVTFRLVAVASGATTTTITGSVVTPTGDSQTVRMVLTHAQTQALTALDNGNHAYRLLILANNGTTNYATLGEGKLYVRTGWSS